MTPLIIREEEVFNLFFDIFFLLYDKDKEYA